LSRLYTQHRMETNRKRVWALARDLTDVLTEDDFFALSATLKDADMTTVVAGMQSFSALPTLQSFAEKAPSLREFLRYIETQKSVRLAKLGNCFGIPYQLIRGGQVLNTSDVTRWLNHEELKYGLAPFLQSELFKFGKWLPGEIRCKSWLAEDKIEAHRSWYTVDEEGVYMYTPPFKCFLILTESGYMCPLISRLSIEHWLRELGPEMGVLEKKAEQTNSTQA
jgi:hypothetical protein